MHKYKLLSNKSEMILKLNITNWILSKWIRNEIIYISGSVFVYLIKMGMHISQILLSYYATFMQLNNIDLFYFKGNFYFIKNNINRCHRELYFNH